LIDLELHRQKDAVYVYETDFDSFQPKIKSENMLEIDISVLDSSVERIPPKTKSKEIESIFT
jgi:hypothetical protein